MRSFLTLSLIALLAQAPAYRAQIDAFHAQREAEIGGPTGWAALAGLHWLTPGRHTVGRAATNDIVLAAPSAPAEAGVLDVRADLAILNLAPGVSARVGSPPGRVAELRPDGPIKDGVVVGGMTMVLIKRGGKLALRMWDQQSAGRAGFSGLRWMPVDAKWRIDATFIPHTPAPRIKIQNVLNDVVDMLNPGAAEFTVGGQTVRLEALLEGDGEQQLFFMFRDGTSGTTTYGAGRYLYSDLPKSGHVVLDFNKAVNPPCAFTAFATCPLPPAANRLGVRIEAGELDHKH